MTLEMKIKMALDDYDDSMEALRKDYERKWKNIRINSFGEAGASETMECNMWLVEQQNRIKNQLIERIGIIDKERNEHRSRAEESVGVAVKRSDREEIGVPAVQSREAEIHRRI